MDLATREAGRYYTELANPFKLAPFAQWAREAKPYEHIILEPFAGANSIITHLKETGHCKESASFDIKPAHPDVIERDSIREFPRGYRVCITNPPWLARSSASRRGLNIPDSSFDNIYKHCLKLCLGHCQYVAALVPASFMQSNLFEERLLAVVLLHGEYFAETENPVCMALFGPRCTADVEVFYDDQYRGLASDFRRYLPKPNSHAPLQFKDPKGELGLAAADSTKEPTIRFCRGDQIKPEFLAKESRFYTRISGELGEVDTLIERLNRDIAKFRNKTKDYYLPAFKGLRKDGQYRRVIGFDLAADFIRAALPGPPSLF